MIIKSVVITAARLILSAVLPPLSGVGTGFRRFCRLCPEWVHVFGGSAAAVRSGYTFSAVLLQLSPAGVDGFDDPSSVFHDGN
jgi:hypothetical protein